MEDTIEGTAVYHFLESLIDRIRLTQHPKMDISLECTPKHTPIDADVPLVHRGWIDELKAAIECNNSDVVQRILNSHALLEAVFIHQFRQEDTVQKD